MSKRLKRFDRSHLSYNFFSSGVVSSVGTGGMSSRSARSISMHPKVNVSLSFHSEKFESLSIGMHDVDCEKTVGNKAAKHMLTINMHAIIMLKPYLNH